MSQHECFKGTELTKQEIHALRRLEKGEASPGEQHMCLQAFMKLTRVYDMHYIPDNERDTNFLLGRAYPGQQILKYLRLSNQLLNAIEG